MFKSCGVMYVSAALRNPEKRFLLGRLLLVTVTLLVGSCGACGGGRPATAPAQLPAFDAQRAFAYLEEQVAFGPRMPGAEGHERQLTWMKALLESLAEQVIEQEFSATTAFGGPHDFTNLVAIFSANAPGPITLIGAHWDTRPQADEDPDPARRTEPVPGANDGASGVAILLELAHILHREPPARPVYLAFFDAEDSGRVGSGLIYQGYCLGSAYLVQHWPGELPQPDRAVVLDLVGGTAKHNPRVPVRTDRGGNDYFDLRIERNSLQQAPDLVNEIWTLAENLGHTAFQRSTQSAIIDDHLPFLAAGIPAVDIIDYPPPIWHTVDDTPEYCSPTALRQVGETMVALIYGS